MIDKNIQQIPSDWKIATLGEVLGKKGYIRGPFGSSLKRNELRSEGIPVYEQQNAIYDHRDFRFFIDGEKHKELSRFTVKENDLIVSCSGTLGKVSLIKNTDLIGIISQALLILRSDIAKILPKYLYYFLISPEGYNSLLSRSTGSVQVNLANRNIIESIELDLPSLPEQRAIASVLSAFDDKIELLREQNKTLEAIAQTLFNRWFVEFNFPDENGQSYLDSGGKMIDSELGEIPEGWRFGKLGDELEVVMGQSPKGETYNTENDGMEFYQGRADFGERFPTIRLFTTDPMKVAEPMDVLLSVRAPVGEINQTLRKCCIGRGLAAIRSNYKSYTFYRLFNEQEKIKLYEDSGTVFGSITKSAIENIEYVVPSQDTVRQFEEKVHILDQKIFNNHFQIQALSQLRDTLLPKLMRGEMRVKGFSD